MKNAKITFFLGCLVVLACSNLEPPTPFPPGYHTPTPRYSPQPYDAQNVTVMFWQDSTQLWFGNYYGTSLFNRQDGSVQKFPTLRCLQPLHTTEPALVWCGGDRFDGTTWHQANSVGEIDPPIQRQDGTVWSSSFSAVLKFDESIQEWQVILQDGGKPSTQFFDRVDLGLDFEAQDGALWFHGQFDFSGINRWTPTSHEIWPFATIDYAMIPRFETSTGEVWATSTWGNIVVLWNGKKWQWWRDLFAYKYVNNETDFLEASDGAIWLAKGADLGRWDGESWQLFTPFSATFQGEVVSQGGDYIYQTHNGDIWVIFVFNFNQVGRWRDQTWQIWDEAQLLHPSASCAVPTAATTILKPQDDFENTMIGKAINPKDRYFIEDNNHHLWIVHANEQGIGRWTGECWRHYTMKDGLSSNDVTVLTFSPDGVLWAGTGDAGINYYNPETDQWIPLPFE